MIPAVFVDRDGTLVEQKDGSYISSINEVKFINQNVYPLLSWFQKEGFLIIIVTNQAGINKGLVTWEQVRRVNDYVVRELDKHKVKVTDVYTCPHRIEENCNCRKPQPGLILRASREHRIDLANSVIIGDRDMDVEAGFRAGVKRAIKI
ncbi:MAG: HAD-IIIA family hydrolase [Thaumarchaeota archaeon]|nr:HAD-IIIA family hydrolase [Nitrososphaerota archaeon]